MFLFNSSFWRSVPGVLLGLGLLVALVLGGWQAGWWFRTQNVNREAQTYQNGYANQSAMRDEISRKLADVNQYTVQISNPAYAAEKQSIVQSRAYAAMLVCGDAAQLNPGTVLPADEQQFISINCLDGSLSPNSNLNVASTPGQ